MYKRILLKLSGEQLQGQHNGGIDTERIAWIAHEVRAAQTAGAQIIIMVGGGNLARGSQLADDKIKRVSADNIGMLATMMNAIAVLDVFRAEGVAAAALSNIQADQVIDQYTHRRAESHLAKGRVVITAGGIGRPYLTTDTAALNLALELACDVVIKTTKVDGVYDRDPAKYSDATKLERITYHDALSNPDIAVMDKAAIGLAMDQHKPVIICDLLADGNIARAVRGEAVGTVIS